MIKKNIVYTALSPLSHNGDETLSTTAPFRRQTVLFNNEIIEIPVISGNSIRGIWRRLGAKYLIEKIGLKEEEISAELYHKLFTGGSLNSSVDHAQITDANINNIVTLQTGLNDVQLQLQNISTLNNTNLSLYASYFNVMQWQKL
jgi:CRISPR/Cas system-associated protein Cas7 (RAMP superfamily)